VSGPGKDSRGHRDWGRGEVPKKGVFIRRSASRVFSEKKLSLS